MLHYSPSSVVSPRYSHSRVLCLAGYRDFPAIYTAMIFDLHQVPLLTSRIVKCNDHVFELWSPNSAQRPFFPGNIRADYVPAPAERRDYQRYDGHSGKHDCMVVPQYFLGHRPHWPFLRRSSMVAATDPAYAAYEVLIPHWEVEDGEPRRGRLTLKFMARLRALNSELDLRMDDFRNALGVTSPAWIGRPWLPSSAHLYSLSELRSWEATVDAGVAVQRGIREKEAWIAFAQARLDLHEISDSALLYEEMPPAREDYIGMWVNGMEERAVLRYMKSGVPCFIVHEYKHSALSRDAMHPDTTPVYDSFLAGTEVTTSLCDANPYQQLGALEGTRLHGIIGGDDGRGPFRTALARDEERSSSIYVESLPPRAPPLLPLPPSRKPPQSTPSTASAPPRFVFPDAAVAPRNRPQPTPSVKRALPKAAPSAPNLPRVVVPIYGPPATNRAPSPAAPSSAPSSFALAAATTASTVAAVDKYAPPPLETREAKGTWTKWELADLNGLPAFIFRGKGWKGETRFERFDRDRKRRLCMHDYADLPGVVKPNHYGAPVPRVPFFIDDNGRGVPQYASHWMYESMTSPRRDEGKRAPQPHAEELPLKAEGKGKARAVLPMGEDSEDEDAIVTGGAGLSLDGVPMRVDEAEAAEASNVVVIEGVDSETSAQMFWRLSIDVLNRVRVAPLSILRAQGMMWVHVESTTAGRRALGALGVLSHGLTLSFRPEVEFMEAARYSVDIWIAFHLFLLLLQLVVLQQLAVVASSVASTLSYPQAQDYAPDQRQRPPDHSRPPRRFEISASRATSDARHAASRLGCAALGCAAVSPPLPLANRLGPRPLAARLESIEEDVEEDSRAERLRSWADRLHAEIEGPRTDPPRSDTSLGKRRGDDEEGERPKKKVRRGRRSGRVVKEMEARKEERRRRAIEREAEEVAATSGTITLTMAPPAAPSQPQASTSAIASTSAVAATSAEREEGEVDDDFVLGASWQEEDDDDDAQAASLYHR
ncbi:hypothetical protein C8R46DRAFT_1234936 [Mycena filopes]|nr:hypothetical protein C8R46DRAFT_1234936 [Mycena filopes]